ncbi:hypothetical protein [Amycolatopsis samaneae]|uniref:Uncharacterized protein n=1 Tax=Amycolatopsis samaneae TaxID=664691 RepID=A0ABW5GMW1_9PSEU
MSRPRKFPRFLDEWREANGEGFTPLSYLNQPDAVPFAIAAQWLFSPDFAEYRGGIFRTELPQGLTEDTRRILDQWFDKFGGDVGKVERIANQLTLWDLFAATDVEPYDEELRQFARSIGRSWNALLKTEFPDRDFTVDVCDEDGSYGPQVTFSSVLIVADQSPVVVYETDSGSADTTVHGIHVDLPRTVLEHLAGRRLVDEVDLRGVLGVEGRPDFAGVQRRIAGFLVDASGRHLALTAFEQLWFKQRSFAIQLLAGLLPQLDAAGQSGRTVSVDLVDLSGRAKEEVINELQRLRDPQLSAPVSVFRYS